MARSTPTLPTLTRSTPSQPITARLDAGQTNRDPNRSAPSAVRRLRSRFRLVAIRWRLSRWVAALAAGLTAAWTLAGASAEAESAREGWGTSLEVVVSRRHLEAGEMITEGSVETISAPVHLIPPGAVAVEPIGRRVTTHIGPGEILVDHRVTTRPGSAASLTLPDDTRGVMLDRTEVRGEVGDIVDLHALISGARLAEGVVVHTDESSVTIAVPRAHVDRVVDAISQGGLVSVLVP